MHIPIVDSKYRKSQASGRVFQPREQFLLKAAKASIAHKDNQVARPSSACQVIGDGLGVGYIPGQLAGGGEAVYQSLGREGCIASGAFGTGDFSDEDGGGRGERFDVAIFEERASVGRAGRFKNGEKPPAGMGARQCSESLGDCGGVVGEVVDEENIADAADFLLAALDSGKMG